MTRLSLLRRLLLALAPVAALLASGCALPPSRSAPVKSRSAAPEKTDTESRDRPANPKTLYAMAKLLASQKRYTECQRLLGKTIQQHPRFMAAYCMLAEQQVRDQRVQDAIQTLKAGLRYNPKDPILSNDLGMCWLLKADYTAAVPQFTRAAGVVPSNTRYRANLALALGMLGRYDEALALYNQVVSNAEAHYNMGVICDARLDLAAATEQYGRARALGLKLADLQAGRRSDLVPGAPAGEGLTPSSN